MHCRGLGLSTNNGVEFPGALVIQPAYRKEASMQEGLKPPDKLHVEDSPLSSLMPSDEWLRLRFPLLHEDTFSDLLLARLKDQYGELKGPDGEESFVLHVKPDDPTYQVLKEELRASLDSLVELSLQTEQTGEPVAARSAISYIVSRGGAPIIEDERRTALGAALSGFDLSCRGSILIADTFSRLSWLLGFGGDLSPEVRMRLLDSLELCLKPGSLVAGEIADCLQNGLQLEFRNFDREGDRKALILRWIHLTARYGPPMLCVLLDVITDSADDIEIKQAAKAAAYDLRGSIRRLWEDTPIDQVSTVESRAERLQQGLSLGYSEADLAQYIISQCKGEPITNADQRLRWLLEIMRNGTERVRLAAARCLTECTMIADPLPETRESLHCVAEILVNAGDSRYVGDAMWILDCFKSNNPDAISFADAAISTATAKFLR